MENLKVIMMQQDTCQGWRLRSVRRAGRTARRHSTTARSLGPQQTEPKRLATKSSFISPASLTKGWGHTPNKMPCRAPALGTISFERCSFFVFVKPTGRGLRVHSDPPPTSVTNDVADDLDERALASVMRTVPLGAGLLAGGAVALLVLGYLIIYLLVFIPRGVVG